MWPFTNNAKATIKDEIDLRDVMVLKILKK